MVGIGVDHSSLNAEKLALEYAKKRAVYLAARKIGVVDANKKAAKFTAEQWQKIVRGATVTQSRREGYNTYAEVNITIVDEELRRALKLPDDFGKASPIEFNTRGVLLLSAFVGQERPYMWEKENILRAPLADEIRRQAHGNVLLPGGDFDDLRLVDYQNVLKVEPDELKPMFERYGAEEIIIVVLTLSQPGSADASTVLLRRLKLGGVKTEAIDIPTDSETETVDARLAKSATMIAGVVTQIATSTAERDQAIRDAAKKVSVRFSYATPKQLARMQDAVRAAPEVLYLDMPSIALARVAGTIYLKGEDDEVLRQNLIKQGILVTSINDGWRLSVR